MSSEVILVNDRDEELGSMEKMQAHSTGTLHRAFSIFIFNSKGELLIQQRDTHKYHSGGLWTNTCCSHPVPGEDTESAAHRRLQEELGFDTRLKKAFSFIYLAKFNNGLTEHEFDHVYTGLYEGVISPAKEEVEDYRYISMAELKDNLILNPDNYTEWFKIALPKLEEYLSIPDHIHDRK